MSNVHEQIQLNNALITDAQLAELPIMRAASSDSSACSRGRDGQIVDALPSLGRMTRRLPENDAPLAT
jgi:hypothetical protein